jgi:TatD DNase family protein
VIQILKEEKANELGGVMHCFVDDLETAKAAIDLGFLISFSGIVTFKNAKPLQEVARQIPLENMLIETDSPYLAPTPLRGKTNQPAYVRYVAEFIADLKEESLENVALNTTKNYEDKFNKINSL